MKGTNIDGDVAIGRNLALGGNVVAQGMAHIKSGLRVDGWLDAENIKAANKGLFQNESELKKEYPKPLAGWFAVVIDDIDKGTGFIYTTVDGTWKKTQEQAMPYEFIMDSVNVFATKNELEQEQKRVHVINDELLKRIQGVSDKSNSAKDPFKFLGTFTRVTGGEFLNALNAMHSTVADVYDGYWRALIGASPVEIYNFAIYYNDDHWIQVLKSPYKWGDGDFNIINDTRYRTIYRIHENGAWGEWKDTEEELLNALKEETLRAKKEEVELQRESTDIIDSIGATIISKRHIIHREIGKPYTALVHIGNLPAQKYKSYFSLYDVIDDDITINLCNRNGDVIVNLGTISSETADLEVTFNIENDFEAVLGVNLPIAEKDSSVDLYYSLVQEKTILNIINDEITRAKNAESANSRAIGEEVLRATKAEKTLQKNIDKTNKIVGVEEKGKLTVRKGAVVESGSISSTSYSAYTNEFEGGDIAITNDGYLIYDARKVSVDGVAEMFAVNSKRLRSEKGYTYQLNISKDGNGAFSNDELEGIVRLYNYEGGDTSELEQKIEKNTTNIQNLFEESVKFDGFEVEELGDGIGINFDTFDGNSGSIEIPFATKEKSGFMSADDKRNLEEVYNRVDTDDNFSDFRSDIDVNAHNISTLLNTKGNSIVDIDISPNESDVELDLTSLNDVTTHIAIPTATTETAGVMSAEDKKALDTATSRALRALFIAAGAEYNDTDSDIIKSVEIPSWQNYREWITEDVVHKSKCYMIGTCGDLTSSDMEVIYNDTKWWVSESCQGISPRGRYMLTPKTHVEYYYKIFEFNQAFNNNKVMQDLWVRLATIANPNLQTAIKVSNITFLGQGSVFKRVIGVIDFSKIKSSQSFNPVNLEYINIIKLSVSLTIKWSPNISKDSVKYMIDNASPSTAITITLHPDAYARLAEDADIVAALTAQPLITLVSA